MKNIIINCLGVIGGFLLVINLGGAFVWQQLKTTTRNKFNTIEMPTGPIESLVADSRGNIYIGERSFCRIQIYDRNGKFIRAISINPNCPEIRISIDVNDRLWIWDGTGALVKAQWHGSEISSEYASIDKSDGSKIRYFIYSKVALDDNGMLTEAKNTPPDKCNGNKNYIKAVKYNQSLFKKDCNYSGWINGFHNIPAFIDMYNNTYRAINQFFLPMIKKESSDGRSILIARWWLWLFNQFSPAHAVAWVLIIVSILFSKNYSMKKLYEIVKNNRTTIVRWLLKIIIAVLYLFVAGFLWIHIIAGIMFPFNAIILFGLMIALFLILRKI
ncbi:MAG: hypothetical protein A2Y62_14800 [Candidatus Fischerbacteria bacterium RBG_13_37_8]|uniref:SMP-30/Gluconolactonase/LRE-like region domain-containing protein n=1 Tax=Candidatus Fischerbacteria bacterium RBG_13_37_8 TaxID=1817863 RepID=A0A1F5VN66_9BACT|nr:MAG: hypothetical protein A2Y62_14800 [Candidatus Fischerbacteria bacterium RBG_13_37_8]